MSVTDIEKALELCRYDPDPGQETKYEHSCRKCPYNDPFMGKMCAFMYTDAINYIRWRSWIPFKVRALTEEEKAVHPDWTCIVDSRVPEENEEILVSVKGRKFDYVMMDVWRGDGLDSGYSIVDDVTAWMPIPESYRED